jgi:colicin import membrane protein
MNDELPPHERDPFVEDLLEAARGDRPREGARARALDAVAAELEVATAVEGAPSLPSTLPWGRVAGVALPLLVAAAVLKGLNIKHQSDLAAAAAAQQAAELAAQTAETRRLMDELRAQTDSVAALVAAVQNAKDDAARAAAQAQLDLAEQQVAAKRERSGVAAGRASGAGGAAAKAKAACNCTPGDPLCSCIP